MFLTTIFKNMKNLLNLRRDNRLGQRLAPLALSSTVGFWCLVSFAQPCQATDFYVSKKVQVSGTGASWQTAWKELADIKWASVRPGDTIKIDGGPANGYLMYDTTLAIGADGTSGSPIKIVSSDESGKDGQVLISALFNKTSGYRNGIDVGNHKYITVSGRSGSFPGNTLKSIRVYGFLYNGIVTGSESDSVTLNDIIIDYNGIGSVTQARSGAGLKLGGKRHNCNRLVICDNSLNVDVSNTYGGYGPTFNKCWIWNQGGSSRCYYTDGVQVNDAYRGGFSWFFFSNCVFGPGLSTGIQFGQKNGGMHVANCLFINPRVTNIKKTVTTFPDASYSMISVNRTTSFLTPQTFDGQGHSCLTFVQGQDGVYTSIFHGGAVSVVGTQLLGSGNVQYKTSGNTVLLSQSQTDPQFVTDVSALGNTCPTGTLQTLLYPSATALINVDFSLKAGSPAVLKGSTITSVAQFLKN